MIRQIKKNIALTALLLVLFIPFITMAASFTFSPSIGSYKPGDVFNVNVYVNPASGESITTAQVILDFPADKLEVLSYQPLSGTPILAHVGTNTDNTNGKIIDNVAFLPAITQSTKIATVTFKAKEEGTATVSVPNDAKILDASNSNKKVATNPEMVFTISNPQPTQAPPAPPSTPTPPANSNSSGSQTNGGTPSSSGSSLDNEATPSSGTSQQGGDTEGATTENNPDLNQNPQNDGGDSPAEGDNTPSPLANESGNADAQLAAAQGLGKFLTWILLAVLVLVAVLVYVYYRKKRD